MRAIDIIMSKKFGRGKKGMVIGWPELLKVAGGTATDILGATPPITLADAIKGKITKLTQYGLCTTVDGDIFCNNGKLTMVDDELPRGYKRLVGIKFDGDIWYETGEALTGDDDVTMTLADTSTTGQNVFGSYNGTGSGSKNFSLYIYGGGAASNCYFRYGSQLLRPRYGDGERTITFGKSGTSGFATDVTATPDTFETPANVYIGMLPNSTSPEYSGSIKGSILAGTRLKWIPAERASDGVIGYYEAVKGNFIAPSGSGTPTSLGYDTSHLTVLSVVGTPEVLTVIQNQNTDPTIVNVTLASASSTVQWNSSSSCIVAPVKPNTVYTIGFLTKPTGGSIFRVATTKTKVTSSGTSAASIAYDLDKNNYEPKTINSGAEAAWMYVQLSNTMTDEDFASIIIQEGTSLTPPQTASAPDLFAVGDYADEVEIISGTVTRRTAVSVSDGVITISALATPVTEHVTPQPLRTNEGDNIISVTANVSPIEFDVTYLKGA